MKKYYPLTFITAAILIMSCEKDPAITKTGSPMILDGWEISKSINNFHINPRDLFFLNEEIGFVVGYNGDIYKTSDSGKLWQKQNSGTTLPLYSVFFLNEDIGFVAGGPMSGCLTSACSKGSVLLKTTDGGDTWTPTFFKDYTELYSLKFFDKLNGLAVIVTPDTPDAKNKFLARTSDGGTTWKLIELTFGSAYNDFWGFDDVVYMISEDQKIYKSINYGIDWGEVNTPADARGIHKMYFYNDHIVYVNGTAHNYKTTDGGSTWEIVDFPFDSFGVFHFYNENEGFNIVAVTANEGGHLPTFKGSLGYETENGGLSWEKSDLANHFHLGITDFPLRDLGYGMTDSGFFTIKKKD